MKRVILFFAVLILINLVYAETNLGPADVKVKVAETSCGDNICNGNETATSCPGDCGEETQPTPGDSGPSPPGPLPPKPECKPNWICDEWSQCENSTKSRTCRDTNQCTEFYERQEEESCTSIQDELDKLTRRKIPFFGFPLWLLLLLLIILLLIIYYLIKKHKKKFKKIKQRVKKILNTTYISTFP